jgi:hypothetical protein
VTPAVAEAPARIATTGDAAVEKRAATIRSMTRWLKYAWGTSHFFFAINLLMMWNAWFLISIMAKPGDRRWLEALWWVASGVSAAA